jgi:Tfp pilus assembly protein PilN
MIQFNLLPDVKLQYIKSQRTKHLVSFISMIAGLIAVGLLLFSMFVVYIVQKQLLNDLNKDIAASSKQLNAIPSVDKMLTVQNQLNTLTGLHEKKPVMSRVFPYLQQLTPNSVSVNKLQIDTVANTISLGGNADSLDAVKVYANALKAATYSVDGGSPQKAFSEVVLSSFSRDAKGASYTMAAKFDPTLFLLTANVQMQVKVVADDTQTSLFGGSN